MVGKTHLHPFFQQKRRFLIKKIHYFPIYRKVLLILGSNFPVMFIRWLSTTFLLTPCLWKSRFLDLTAVNMQKNVFLAIFWIYILTNSIPLPLSNSLRQLSNSFRQLSNLLTLQLTTSPTHLLTYSPTLSTNGGSTSSSLVISYSPYLLYVILCLSVCLYLSPSSVMIAVPDKFCQTLFISFQEQ